MSNKNPMDIYERDRAERLANLAPQRSQFDAPDVFSGKRDEKGDKRIRDHRAQQFREWHFRVKGRQPSDAEVNTFLDGPDAA
jgi:hypothetical protein